MAMVTQTTQIHNQRIHVYGVQAKYWQILVHLGETAIVMEMEMDVCRTQRHATQAVNDIHSAATENSVGPNNDDDNESEEVKQLWNSAASSAIEAI